jgi:hypothetical protein
LQAHVDASKIEVNDLKEDNKRLREKSQRILVKYKKIDEVKTRLEAASLTSQKEIEVLKEGEIKDQTIKRKLRDRLVEKVELIRKLNDKSANANASVLSEKDPEIEAWKITNKDLNDLNMVAIESRSETMVGDWERGVSSPVDAASFSPVVDTLTPTEEVMVIEVNGISPIAEIAPAVDSPATMEFAVRSPAPTSPTSKGLVCTQGAQLSLEKVLLSELINRSNRRRKGTQRKSGRLT